jgi:hypothetical protein
MYSSHSGTPIFSPALAVVGAVVAGVVLVAGLLALPAVAFVAGSDLEQPVKKIAQATQSIKETLFSI